jgi:protein-tyrosine-phosphatase
MAEYLLRAALERRGCEDVDVDSSGTWATSGIPATSDAADTLAALGVDLSPHRARHLEPLYLEAADLVVVMTSVHEREVLHLSPETEPKLLLLKELAEMKAALQDAGDGSDSRARLGAFLRAPRPERRRALDVDDPMGLPITAYQRCASELRAGVDALVEVLCG